MGWRVLGGSVPGPAHQEELRSNEDAWQTWADSFGLLVVVCDGLGSRPCARRGARAAVRAVRLAWRHWAPAPVASSEDFIRLIEVLWRLELKETIPDQACTTCLIVGIRPDGKVILAQLGDGIIGWLNQEQYQMLSQERESFSSVTLSLGSPHKLQDWRLQLLHAPPSNCILMATDGVSDDLRPERRSSFLLWLKQEVASAEDAETKLKKALLDWPVPYHRDDKTLVLLWNPQS